MTRRTVPDKKGRNGHIRSMKTIKKNRNVSLKKEYFRKNDTVSTTLHCYAPWHGVNCSLWVMPTPQQDSKESAYRGSYWLVSHLFTGATYVLLQELIAHPSWTLKTLVTGLATATVLF